MQLVVAWDGASFDLIDPLIAKGELPNLAQLVQKGQRVRLESTWPAVTFPAWTSFMTAASPGRHGLTDFCIRQGYELRFTNATHRRLPTVWSRLNSAGLRTGVYGLPATYPPEPLDGLQVPGFDTPLGAGSARRLTHPEDLAGRLRARYGRLGIEGIQQSQFGEGWHRDALARMLDDIDLRTRIVTDLLREQRFDLFLVHFAESDTVSHQFWQFCDPASPRHVPAPEFEPAIATVYRRLDRALGDLVAAAGEGATVMVVSDHGSGGASDRAIAWNRWLSDSGHLAFRRAGGRGARAIKRAALSVVPASLQPSLLRRWPELGARLESRARLGAIDWRSTRAFSEELPYYPAIWLNLRGREPQGVVDPADADSVLRELETQLAELRDPLGNNARVVRRTYRREELFSGPWAGLAPDLIVELEEPDGYSYAAVSSRGGSERSWIRRLTAAEMTGERGTSMAGAHRREGVCVLAGEGVSGCAPERASIADAGAVLLAQRGLAPDAGADGRSWLHNEGFGSSSERDMGANGEGENATVPTVAADSLPTLYDEEAEAEVEERLRALGYLD